MSEGNFMRHRNTVGSLCGGAIVWSAILTASLSAQQQSPPSPPGKTQVVLLGTGTPFRIRIGLVQPLQLLSTAAPTWLTSVLALCAGPRQPCSTRAYRPWNPRT